MIIMTNITNQNKEKEQKKKEQLSSALKRNMQRRKIAKKARDEK